MAARAAREACGRGGAGAREYPRGVGCASARLAKELDLLGALALARPLELNRREVDAEAVLRGLNFDPTIVASTAAQWTKPPFGISAQ